MSKSHAFNIYLLKPEYNNTNSLEDDHKLELTKASNLPEDG